MKHVVIRVVGAVEHSNGWNDEPSWWLVIKVCCHRGEESMSLGPRIAVVGDM